jgi:sterol desaturase/sphingolipid hydroxylase (fatty acid hydroxylase superfamily)
VSHVFFPSRYDVLSHFLSTVATNYSHWFESLLNFFTVIIGPWLIGMRHPFELGLWFFLSLWESTVAHCGYALPFSIWSLPFLRQAVHHDYHHSHNQGNFGVFVGLTWDRLFGTNASFNKNEAKEKDSNLKRD